MSMKERGAKMGRPSRFVVCYTTRDGVRAVLHAYADGDGSLRDNNHVREIVREFTHGKRGRGEQPSARRRRARDVRDLPPRMRDEERHEQLLRLRLQADTAVPTLRCRGGDGNLRANQAPPPQGAEGEEERHRDEQGGVGSENERKNEMKVYRMTFDIAVSKFYPNDVYTLESLISKAICSNNQYILAVESRKENCLICNCVDASKMIDKQNKEETK